jgi:hypothetical protein
MFERMDEDFRLVQPRRISGRIPGLPPALTPSEVPLRTARYVAGAAVLDQEDPSQLLVLPMKQLQLGEVVLRIVARQEGQLHQPAMHDKEHQHVDRPVPGVIELLLLDRPGNRSPDRGTLQDLEGWDLIDAHHPDALLGQPCRIPVAPKHLLRPLLEPGVQPGRLPVPSPVGLQVNVVQDAADRGRADRRDDLVSHRLPGQVLAGPVGDVQPLGDRLEAGQLNDLCPLHGGDLLRVARIALTAVGKQARQTGPAIPLASPPNGGLITFEPGGERTLPLPSSDGQDDLGSEHLEAGQGSTMGGGMQRIPIPWGNEQGRWSASTHEGTSHAGEGRSPAYQAPRIHCKFCERRH